MDYTEHAAGIDCGGARLVGILTMPGAGGLAPAPVLAAQGAKAAPPKRGVLIAVGGAQYRAGSHRQFTLMARALAAQGTPVLRFDYRGMGDSEGEPVPFDEAGEDLRAAIDYFCATAGVNEVVLLGLCDAATGSGLYAASDKRVCGLVMINPWVRSEQGAARATLRHYYRQRLLQRDLWLKILRLDFNWRASFSSFLNLMRKAAGGGAPLHASGDAVIKTPASSAPIERRLYQRLRGFRGEVLVILCSADLTAQEFADLIAGSREWRKLVRQYRSCTLAGADHTFSRRVWREQALSFILDWNASW